MAAINAAVIEVPVDDTEAMLNAALTELAIDSAQFIQAVVLSTESTNRTAKIIIFYEAS